MIGGASAISSLQAVQLKPELAAMVVDLTLVTKRGIDNLCSKNPLRFC